MATRTVTKPRIVKRVTVKPKKNPNPLFRKWLKEWIAEAVAKDTKVRFGYRKALHSLQKYPLALQSGKECAILQDFGPKLCARLDEKLAEYRANKGTGSKANGATHIPSTSNHSSSPAKKDPHVIWDSNRPTPSTSVPSAPLQPPQPNMRPATATTAPKSPSCKRPATANTAPKSPAKKGKKNTDSQSQPIEDLVLAPGSFDIILVVDNAELLGSTKSHESATRQELTSLAVNFNVRSLKVGDYAWIARDIESGSEMILPYIVERKRLDDLACSIKDGRYREQKFRLKQCGIQNLIYLIESTGKGDLHLGLPLRTLQQASVNTEIHGEFVVKHVSSHRSAMEYLAAMTAVITRTYKDKVLVQCKKELLGPSNVADDLVSLMSFTEFNKAASKIRKWRVREMFIKHLIQLRGMSVEKAIAIVDRYPSPRSLLAAYSDTTNGAALLAKIPHGMPSRTVGPVASAAVFRLYMLDQLM